MIIKELKSRGLISRILVALQVLLHNGLLRCKKFHEKFHVILPSDYDICRLTDSEDVYGDQVIRWIL